MVESDPRFESHLEIKNKKKAVESSPRLCSVAYSSKPLTIALAELAAGSFRELPR